MTLKELQIGKSAVVDTVGGTGALRQHFLDMGLVPGAQVTLIKLAPMGDPMELRIHGYELTLRLDDAAQIGIIPTEKVPAAPALVDDKMVDHPGLGEGGKYHIKKGEHPLPDGTTLTFALAGNQNCGKTTLFNQLTGSNQHVGNFPGVTVDRKSGAIKGHPETEVTDLPGIYSMSPYSSEEIVTRQFIIGEKPTGIINIVDATNIERNLYLTMQLMELDTPMVLALNMMDEMRGNGGTVRINKMESMLGIPVIPISAAKNEGVDELVDHAVHVAKYQERPGRMDFCSEDDHGGAVHRCIHGIIHLIEDHAKAAGIPVRFAATKLVEGDHRIEEALKLDQNEKEMIEHIIVQMEQERGLDRAAAIADMRFSFIQELVAQTVVKPHESKEQLRSNRIDKFLTGKYTAIPAFIAIMGLVFYLTFNVIGLFFQNLMEAGIDALTGAVDTLLTNWNINEAIHSLIIDGVFTGVGSVLSFLPIIVVLFFFLSMLEDTGYMARVAFVMDKLLRRIGDDQCDQGHVDDVRHVVNEVVQLGEEAVQLTDIAPDQADDDAEDALAHGNDEGQTDGHLSGVPHLTPVVAAEVVGAEPVFTVGLPEGQRGIRHQRLIIVLADGQRDEREDDEEQEQDKADDSSLVLEEVLDDRTPVAVVGVADTLGFFRRVIDEVEQFVLLLALKIRCFSHQRAASFPVRVMRGSTSIISTSPRKTPTMPSAA